MGSSITAHQRPSAEGPTQTPATAQASRISECRGCTGQGQVHNLTLSLPWSLFLEDNAPLTLSFGACPSFHLYQGAPQDSPQDPTKRTERQEELFVVPTQNQHAEGLDQAASVPGPWFLYLSLRGSAERVHRSPALRSHPLLSNGGVWLSGWPRATGSSGVHLPSPAALRA